MTIINSASLSDCVLNYTDKDDVQYAIVGSRLPEERLDWKASPLAASVQYSATPKRSPQFFFIDKTTHTGSYIGSYLRFDYSSGLGSPIDISGKTAGIAHLTTNLDFNKYLKVDDSFSRKNMTSSDTKNSIIFNTTNTEADEVRINHRA